MNYVLCTYALQKNIPMHAFFHNYTVLICVVLCMPSSVSVLMEIINRYFARVLAVTVTSSVDDWFNHAQAV